MIRTVCSLCALLWTTAPAMGQDPESAMIRSSDKEVVLSSGELYEREPWTHWEIIKRKGEKPLLRVRNSNENTQNELYQSPTKTLQFLGFLDATKPARKLEDIGKSWKISPGVHGYKQPVWLLDAGKNMMVFLDAKTSAFQVLTTVNYTCKEQLDLDPTDTGFAITRRNTRNTDATEVIETNWTPTSSD